MAKKKTTVEKLADLESKTEKTPEDLQKIDDLKLDIEIEKEEKNKSNCIPEDLHKELGEILKIKLRLENKPEKFKLQEKLDELSKEASKYTGLKAKKNQTIHINTVEYFFTKDFPNPIRYTDLFNDKQKEQYFQ
jgi:hypothetical protein